MRKPTAAASHAASRQLEADQFRLDGIGVVHAGIGTQAEKARSKRRPETAYVDTRAIVSLDATDPATMKPGARVIPGGTWQDRTLTGEMFETTGPAYFAEAFDPSRVVVRPVGHAQMGIGNRQCQADAAHDTEVRPVIPHKSDLFQRNAVIQVFL